MGAKPLEFIDTNILLYAYDASDDNKHSRASGLVMSLGRGRRGVLSVQVLQEFYVNATAKIAQPLSPPEATERIRAFSLWKVHSPTASDVVDAIALSVEHQLSFWDSMIIQSAATLGCNILWSEDLNSGQMVSGVRIQNPFAD